MIKRICAVIVNFKTAELTRDCVYSLAPQLDRELDRIVVVDNASGGTDLERLSRYLTDPVLGSMVEILPLSENNGFSAGNNAGILACEAEYYLLTNSDTIFRDGAVSELLKATLEFPEAGLYSPRLEWPDGKAQTSCFRFMNLFSEIIHSANTGIITRILQCFDVSLLPVSRISHPAWTSFACVLLRKTAADCIGLLDDGFFMYFEDMDYCRRIRMAGFDIINWPESHVIHLQGKSSDMDDRARARKRLPSYYFYSRSRYYYKYYGVFGPLLANVFWIAGRMISIPRQAMSNIKPPVSRGEFFDIWKRRAPRIKSEKKSLSVF